MAGKRVADDPFYPELSVLIGCPVRVGLPFEKPQAGLLSIWTSDEGNEGWLVSNTPGSFGTGAYTLFSSEIVHSVRFTAIGPEIILRA